MLDEIRRRAEILTIMDLRMTPDQPARDTSRPLGAFGSCIHCDFYKHLLMERDRTIFDLQHKVRMVHAVTSSNVDSDFNVGGLTILGQQHPLNIGNPWPCPVPFPVVAPTPLPNFTAFVGSVCSNSPSLSAQKSFPVNSELKEQSGNIQSNVGVIRIQEIIDKVVERRSPGQKGSSGTDNGCFKNLLRRLESDLKLVKEEDNIIIKPVQQAVKDEEAHSSGSEYETHISSNSNVSSSFRNESTSNTSGKSVVRSKSKNGGKGNKRDADATSVKKAGRRERKRSYSNLGLPTSPKEKYAVTVDMSQSSCNKSRKTVDDKISYNRTTETLKIGGYWKVTRDSYKDSESA